MVRPVCLCVVRALLLTLWGDPAGALLSTDGPDSVTPASPTTRHSLGHSCTHRQPALLALPGGRIPRGTVGRGEPGGRTAWGGGSVEGRLGDSVGRRQPAEAQKQVCGESM